MSADTRASILATPAGPVRLRAETAEDQAFHYALFCESRPDLLLLPVPAREGVIQMQFKVQTAGYRAHYPGASDDIILLGTHPVAVS